MPLENTMRDRYLVSKISGTDLSKWISKPDFLQAKHELELTLAPSHFAQDTELVLKSGLACVNI